jgi:hypothetical protein
VWLVVLLGATVAWGQGSSPFARGEVLNYSVNWPSGLSLGEAQFKVGGGEPGWKFEFSLDASLPGFEIKERYQSTAGGQFCSEILEKEFVRGVRKGREKVTYDQKKRVAERQTLGGGRSEVSVPECVKDGLTFLFFLPAQAVNLGAPYQVTASYADSPQLEVSGTRQTTDRVLVSFRGPASSHTIEMFFARDAARTPVLVRAPFSLGIFALELVR